MDYIDDKTFSKLVFTSNWESTSYENCVFEHCTFDKTDFSNSSFTECEFNSCTFRLCKVYQATFKECICADTQLVGLHFDKANTISFSIQFNSCKIEVCSFVNMNLKLCEFNQTRIKECDFSNSDLTNIVFEECDLIGSIFSNTILDKTDFRTATNYRIHPETNRLKKTRFSRSNLEGLLRDYDIRLD